MKAFRSLLSLVLAAAMVALAPGAGAWAQVAAVSGEAVSAGAGVAAPARGLSAGPSSALTFAPLTTSLSAGAPALSAPVALPAPAASAAASAAAPRLGAAPAAPASAEFAAPVAAVAPAAASAAGAPSAAPALAPAGTARAEAVAEPLARTSRAFAASRGGTGFAAALDRLFLGTWRARGAVDASAPAFAPAAAARESGLRPSAGSSAAAPAAVPAPVSARGAARAAAGPVLGAAGVMWLAASYGLPLVQVLAAPFIVFASLVLHEIGHARLAAWFGDATAASLDRASFNPLTWHKQLNLDWSPRNPLPMKILPLDMGARTFTDPVWGRARLAAVALAGPAVNAGLAVAGALAFAGAAAIGLGAPVLAVLTGVVFVNSVLALYNLAPIRPLDGSHVLSALLPRSVAARLESAYAGLGRFQLVPLVLFVLVAGGAIIGAAAALTQLLIGLSVAATGVQLASASLPAIAALGLAIGALGPSSGAPAAPAAPRPGTTTLVVVFDPSAKASVTKDLHLMQLDARRPDYALAYQRAYGSLMSDVSALGVAPETLASYNASPVASYKRINAATFTLDAGKAEEFSALLRARGHKVYPNERRRIITPVPFQPEDADPTSRTPVSMEENLKITRADLVQQIAQKRWGAPDLNPWQRAVQGARRLLTGDAPAQPKVGVVDSGADQTHPLLKRVKQVLNFTTDANVDDIGHGSWVTSMVLNYAPWLSNLTHYKTFTNGGATLDDILKALTAAANDGNLVISNSWGSDDGDPESPDSKLVQQLAQEGHILVFAAGNAGPGANTIGSPAIIQYKDPKTGAIRVVAVAATDRNKKVAGFSSVGPGSPKTAGQTGFAHRPDLASDGVNTEGAWPAALGDADRTDAAKGPIKAISGTSMSTPTVAGAIVLLAMLFGVTEIGPKLDAVVVALMSTLQKTGKNDVDHEGGGFLDVEAAYELLFKQFNPDQTPPTALLRRQALQARLTELDEAAKPALSGPSIDSPFGDMDGPVLRGMAEEHSRVQAELDGLEAAYPGIGFHALSPLARAWARLIGRAPVPPRVAEYRRLAAQVEADDESRAAFYRGVAEQPDRLRDDLVDGFQKEDEPVLAGHRKALADFVSANPDVEYASAGFWGRLGLRLGGRAPVKR
jgi:Zn-dependent protease